MSNKLKSIFLICLFLFVLPLFVSAQEKFFEGETATEMIRNIYWFGVAIIGILAVVVIVIGGIMYMQSYGDPQKITKAKQLIGGALIGVVLLLFSYTILRTVNPALVRLREPVMKVEVPELGKGANCGPASVPPGKDCENPYICCPEGAQKYRCSLDVNKECEENKDCCSNYCNPTSKKCEMELNVCRNGKCERGAPANENCENCPEDCGCDSPDICCTQRRYNLDRCQDRASVGSCFTPMQP